MSVRPLGSGALLRLGRLSVREPVLDVAYGSLASILLAAAAYKIGIDIVVFGVIIAAAALFGLANPAGFAVGVMALGLLPSLGALVGRSVPVGLDPVDVLVVFGIGVLGMRGAEIFPFGRNRLLAVFTGANLALLFAAWFRTYSVGPVSGSTIALVVKPLILLAAAIVVVEMLPRDRVIETIALTMAAMMGVVGLSIIAQRVGLYHVYNQDARGLKQYGGLMLSGNAGGLVYAVFAVPTYVLLRACGRGRLGIAVLAWSVPILLITLARGAIISFAASLLVLALLDTQRGAAIRVIGTITLAAVAWAKTGGAGQVAVIRQNLQDTANDTNGTLSGRPAIWHQAIAYLDSGHWLNGGGLNAFHTFGIGNSVTGYATHNMYLDILTTGGIVMMTAIAVLFLAMWRVGSFAPPELAVAIRVAIISILLLGISSDFDVFSRTAIWLWVLVAAAVRLSPRGRIRHDE